MQHAAQRRAYARGDTIFSPAEHPEYVYLLEEGVVRLLTVSPNGQELTLEYVRPGDLFGTVSVMTGSAREVFAQATTAAKILRIPKTAFLKAVRAADSVLHEVTKQMGQRLIRARSRMEDLVFRDVRSRLARILLSLAEEHGRETDRGLALGLPLTQAEIATLIGSTRQSVSTFLREMKSRRLVEHRGRELVITNPRGLRAVAARTSA